MSFGSNVMPKRFGAGKPNKVYDIFGNQIKNPPKTLMSFKQLKVQK